MPKHASAARPNTRRGFLGQLLAGAAALPLASEFGQLATAAPPTLAAAATQIPLQLFLALAKLVDEALDAALEGYDPDCPNCGETFLYLPDGAAECRKVFRFFADVAVDCWLQKRPVISDSLPELFAQLRERRPVMLPPDPDDMLANCANLVTATKVSWPFRQAAIWANGSLRCLRTYLRDHDDAAVEAAAIALRSVTEFLEMELMPCEWTPDLNCYLDGILGVQAVPLTDQLATPAPREQTEDARKLQAALAAFALGLENLDLGLADLQAPTQPVHPIVAKARRDSGFRPDDITDLDHIIMNTESCANALRVFMEMLAGGVQVNTALLDELRQRQPTRVPETAQDIADSFRRHTEAPPRPGRPRFTEEEWGVLSENKDSLERRDWRRHLGMFWITQGVGSLDSLDNDTTHTTAASYCLQNAAAFLQSEVNESDMHGVEELEAFRDAYAEGQAAGRKDGA